MHPVPAVPPTPAPHPHPRQQVSLLCRARSLLRVGAAGPGAASAPGLDSSGMSQAVWVVAPCSLGTSPPGTLQPLPVPPQSPSHLSGHPTSWWHPPETPRGKQLVTQAVTLEPCSQLDVTSSHCCCPHCLPFPSPAHCKPPWCSVGPSQAPLAALLPLPCCPGEPAQPTPLRSARPGAASSLLTQPRGGSRPRCHRVHVGGGAGWGPAQLRERLVCGSIWAAASRHNSLGAGTHTRPETGT